MNREIRLTVDTLVTCKPLFLKKGFFKTFICLSSSMKQVPKEEHAEACPMGSLWLARSPCESPETSSGLDKKS